MSQNVDLLIEKLEEFSTNLQLVKKIMNRDDGNVRYILCQENDRTKLDKTFDKLAELTIEIEKKFQSTKKNQQEKLRIQKLQKDFKNKIIFYTKILEEYRDSKDAQVRKLRKTIQYSKNKPRAAKKTNYSSDQESQNGPKQIQLQAVHQQTLFQEHIIELKEKQLLEIHEKMQQALKVQKQVGRLVHEQGEQLDMIEENVDSARSNVKEGGDLLQEGVKQHVSANRKKFCIMGVVFVLLLVIIVPIMVKVL